MKRDPAHQSSDYSDAAIGRRLAIFREGLGLTQREISDIVGSKGDGASWSHYELGRRLIPVHVANILTLKYGLDIAWIYQGRMTLIDAKLAEIIARGEAILRKRRK